MESYGFNFATTYTTLPDSFFTLLNPEHITSPKIVIVNQDLAQSLGLDFTNCDLMQQAALFSGNKLPDGATPFAQAYAGHQFGHFTMLGDGRAVVWGEHITPSNDRVDIQFKGSGQTPYSRRGDGKAVLGPMLREYIIAEAMHALGIPTTRSLAVAATGERVMRETALPGAILTRTAKSHIRVGTFQFAAAQLQRSELALLLDYTIQRHYPKLITSNNKALALLAAVMESQAELIVHWLRVGFIHGVMNTDNMLLSGETIDYGPCAFMDSYNENTVFSSIDTNGRYAYANQGQIAQWNIIRLAEALLPLIADDTSTAVTMAENTIKQFSAIYKNKWLAMMRAKLGMFGEYAEDEKIITDLLSWMQTNAADYTNTFRMLSNADEIDGGLYKDKYFTKWRTQWQDRLKNNKESMQSSITLMQHNNPAVIPRNHKVEEALSAAHSGDFKYFHDIIKVLQYPYTRDKISEDYTSPPSPEQRVYQTFCGT